MNGYHLFFDADDTLWDEQRLLQLAEREVEQSLNLLCGGETGFARRFINLESENIPYIGYGLPSYMFSFAEAIASNSEWHCHKHKLMHTVHKLINRLTMGGPALLPGVGETLAALSSSGYRLHVLTRGIESEQRLKLGKSGLTNYFDRIFIVPKKDKDMYEASLASVGVPAYRACMVGNSVCADVNPAIEAGMYAVWIPSETMWEHDKAGIVEHQRAAVVRSFPDLLHLFLGEAFW